MQNNIQAHIDSLLEVLSVKDCVWLGIVGPPGSGKSTIAQFLEEFLLRDKNVRVGRIQMDGYHIPKNKLSAQDMQRSVLDI
jgi:pantothenate kinase